MSWGAPAVDEEVHIVLSRTFSERARPAIPDTASDTAVDEGTGAVEERPSAVPHGTAADTPTAESGPSERAEQPVGPTGPAEPAPEAAESSTTGPAVETPDGDGEGLDVVDLLTHELRTPLATVATLAHMIDQQWDRLQADERRELVGRIATRARGLDELVGRLLDLSRAQRGHLQVEPRPLPLRPVIEEVLVALREGGDTADLVVDVPDDVDVLVDPVVLRGLLRNLLSNAMKFTSASSAIVVTARPLDDRVEVGIADEGPGIDPSEQDLIFLPGYRASKAPEGGSGMGLAISRAYVEALGGQLWVESLPGAGSTFWFTVPKASSVRSGHPR